MIFRGGKAHTQPQAPSSLTPQAHHHQRHPSLVVNPPPQPKTSLPCLHPHKAHKTHSGHLSLNPSQLLDPSKGTETPNSLENSTFLAEGYTEDGMLSKYDNVTRPISSASALEETLNSLSFNGKIDENLSYTSAQMISQSRVNFSNGRSNSTYDDQKKNAPRPKGCMKLIIYYCQKLHRFRVLGPWILLLIYSILGAIVFFYVEHEHEQELFKREKDMIDNLRNRTIRQLAEIMSHPAYSRSTKAFQARDALVKFQTDVERIRLPEALEWDMWGALFYVGTVFTTIGYGNITPRTSTGQVLSIFYAVFGIPLVLAILSKTGKDMTDMFSRKWILYRHWIKKKHMQHKSRRKSKTSELHLMEGGRINDPLATSMTSSGIDLKSELEEELESRTIPIWLALFVCLSYICICAGMFCIWEKKWSYFTSFYFIFISLSTIGLGDVVPEYPRMLIVMFVLIKMEEFLYSLIMEMQKEYKEALDTGDFERAAELLKECKENPILHSIAPHIINNDKIHAIEEKIETFEKVIQPTNTRMVQTEDLDSIMTNDISISDPKDDKPRNLKDASTAVSSNLHKITEEASESDNNHLIDNFKIEQENAKKENGFVTAPHSFANVRDATDSESISDITSLPLDPINSMHRSHLEQSLTKEINDAFDMNEEEYSSSQFSTAMSENSAESVIKRGVHDQSIECSLWKQTPVIATHDEAVQSNIHPLQRDAYIACTLFKDDAVDRSTATSLKSWADRSTSVSQVKDSPVLSAKKNNVDVGLATENTQQNDATTSVDIINDDKSVNTSLQEDIQEKIANNSKIFSTDATTSITIDEKEDKSCCTSLRENNEMATGTRSFEFDTIVNVPKSKVEKVDFCGETDEKSWADVSIDAGIESHDKSACTSLLENIEAGVGTDRVEFNNRSMETSEIVYWRGESSRCVQTMFPEDLDEARELMDAVSRRKRFSNANKDFSFEEHLSNHDVSIQYSLSELDVCETGVQTLLSTYDLNLLEESATRSKATSATIKITKNDSTTSLDGSDEMLYGKKDAVTKQDLIIQTDDSYLKIARRLDEYRTNRSQGISVYTVGQTSPSHRRKNSRFLAAASGFARRRSSRSPRVPRFPRNATTTPVDEGMTTRPEILEPPSFTDGHGSGYLHTVASTSTEVGRSDDDTSEYSELSESTYKASKSSYFYSGEKTSSTATSNLLSVAQSAQKKTAEKAKRSVSWRPKLLSRASTSSLFGNEEKKSVKQISASFDHSTVTPTHSNLERTPRRSSLPVPIKNSIPNGRVRDYILKHEKGIHSPGTVEGLKKGMVEVIDMRPSPSG